MFHDGVNETTLPLASLPVAVNCCVAPGCTVLGLGVTVIIASPPDVTVTVDESEMTPTLAEAVLL
jgi:hypothetical protein